MAQRPVCLTIGGSDSCGGAGIQADLRVFNDIGVHGCSAITALTAQNPEAVTRIEATSIDQFKAEIHAIADYYDIACIKTGMLVDDAHVKALSTLLDNKLQATALIVDPVLISSSGKALFDSSDVRESYAALLKRASLWTPNLQEAELFLGHPVDDAIESASALLLKYEVPVLLKGGHGNGKTLRDILCMPNGSIDFFQHTALPLSRESSHGTGCRLASAIAAYLAQGNTLPASVSKAHVWLQEEFGNHGTHS